MLNTSSSRLHKPVNTLENRSSSIARLCSWGKKAKKNRRVKRAEWSGNQPRPQGFSLKKPIFKEKPWGRGGSGSLRRSLRRRRGGGAEEGDALPPPQSTTRLHLPLSTTPFFSFFPHREEPGPRLHPIRYTVQHGQESITIKQSAPDSTSAVIWETPGLDSVFQSAD